MSIQCYSLQIFYLLPFLNCKIFLSIFQYILFLSIYHPHIMVKLDFFLHLTSYLISNCLSYFSYISINLLSINIYNNWNFAILLIYNSLTICIFENGIYIFLPTNSPSKGKNIKYWSFCFISITFADVIHLSNVALPSVPIYLLVSIIYFLSGIFSSLLINSFGIIIDPIAIAAVFINSRLVNSIGSSYFVKEKIISKISSFPT